jgi:hypothetical protein
MVYLLIASVALVTGVCLGVLLMRLLDASDPDEWWGRTRAHAPAGSAWWR